MTAARGGRSEAARSIEGGDMDELDLALSAPNDDDAADDKSAGDDCNGGDDSDGGENAGVR